jgi:hypothetical protein
MNIIERAKNILIKPKEEWLIIDQENTPVSPLVTSYLIPLAMIPAIAAFIKYGFIGFGPYVGASLTLGIKYALISFVTTMGSVYLSAFVIDALSTSFGSTKDFRKAMQLVIYSYTPMLLVGIFQIIPGLGFLAIVGLYGLYILYLGIAPLMKTPQDKVTGYFVLSLIVIIVIYFLLAALISAIIFGGSFAASVLR